MDLNSISYFNFFELVFTFFLS